MIRLVQISDGSVRHVAAVQEPHLRLLREFDSVYRLASIALARGSDLSSLVAESLSAAILNYDEIYRGNSNWRLLVPFDHPTEPARMLVSGTGLTHLGSARDRQAMHVSASEVLTDSMKMFRWGLEGGRPAPGKIGIAPEWFYKGDGAILRAPGQPLDVPPYAEDGGEEAEIVGLYFVDADGSPHRVGMAIGNEFSDHQFEKRNYLNLAGSKMRTCSIGPELVIDGPFQSVVGSVSIEREGQSIWSKPIRSGEKEMCHSLANIEYHHFKFESHRRPGNAHVHYFGAHSLSFGDGIKLIDGDVMVIAFEGFGRPLRNVCRVAREPAEPVGVVVMK